MEAADALTSWNDGPTKARIVAFVQAVTEPGDLVVVFQSGAYGPSASPQAFLGHPRCAEVLV